MPKTKQTTDNFFFAEPLTPDFLHESLQPALDRWCERISNLAQSPVERRVYLMNQSGDGYYRVRISVLLSPPNSRVVTILGWRFPSRKGGWSLSDRQPDRIKLQLGLPVNHDSRGKFLHKLVTFPVLHVEPVPSILEPGESIDHATNILSTAAE